MQDTLIGSVTHIVFAGAENGFTVARLTVESSAEEVVIVGTMPSLQPGEYLSCIGTWKNTHSMASNLKWLPLNPKLLQILLAFKSI